MWNKHFKLQDDDRTVKCEHCGQIVEIGYKNLIEHLEVCKDYTLPKYNKFTLKDIKRVFNGLYHN